MLLGGICQQIRIALWLKWDVQHVHTLTRHCCDFQGYASEVGVST